MLKPHARIDKFETLSWGLGFGVQHPPAGPQSFWHWGDWGIFQHFAIATRDEGSALVAMTNSNGLAACREVVQATLGSEQAAFQWLFA
jgi:hypothetical protein